MYFKQKYMQNPPPAIVPPLTQLMLEHSSFCSTVNATIEKPLITIARNARGKIIATRYWHAVNISPNNVRTEEIWASTTELTKSYRDFLLNLKALLPNINNSPAIWSASKRISPENASVAIINYNPFKATHSLQWLLSHKGSNKNNLPHTPADYYQFATNPNYTFTADQARALYFLINYLVDAEQLQRFLMLWPGIDHLDQVAKQTRYHLNPLPNKPLQEENFPHTLEHALQAQIWVLEQQGEQVEIYQPPEQSQPLLSPVPQPAPNHPLTIPNLTTINYAVPHLKPCAPAEHTIWLQVTPAGKQNARREVFYAKPTHATQRNPTCAPFPMSPLKSTVAVLYCDTNPESPTHNQPIVKSINAKAHEQEQIDEFIETHRKHLNPEQLEALRPTITTKEHKTMPTFEPAQPIPCAHCQTMFQPERISSKFCSAGCRTTYHSLGRRKPEATAARQALVTPVQAELEKQAQDISDLKSKMDQLISLLTPKG